MRLKDRMVEITGEVDTKEREQQRPPGSLFGKQEHRYIPILKLRVVTDSGNLIQVIYKGETAGDANLGDQVSVKGMVKDGVLHAVSIYNHTTNSWVTGKSRDCFIATAAYGSSVCKEVDLLVSFRDKFMTRSYIGRRLINLYYALSPRLAAFIKDAYVLRIIVRFFFLQPLIGVIKNYMRRTR